MSFRELGFEWRRYFAERLLGLALALYPTQTAADVTFVRAVLQALTAVVTAEET